MGAVEDESGATASPPLSALLPPPPPDPLADELRERLVALLRQGNALHEAAVARALLRVPRHLFLPQVQIAQAYADAAVPTRWENGIPVSSASQPAIVALMLEQLQLAPGMRVLEIGAGTGYNGALLAELVGPDGQVTTMDIDPEIAAEAREHLAAAGYPGVRVVVGDGWEGWAEAAPYDRVVLTVGASDISPAWFDQLGDNGLLVLPLCLRAAEASIAFRKRWGRVKSESVTPCGFMRLRGAASAAAGAEQWAALPGGWRVVGESARELAGPIAQLLGTPPRLRFWPRPPQNFAQYLGLRGHAPVSFWPDLQPSAQSAPQSAPRPDAKRARGGHVRGRLGLYLDAARGGPSLALFAIGKRFLLTYGTPAAERALHEAAAALREVQLAPLEAWTVVGYPRGGVDGVPPPEPGAVRLARPHFIFDILPGAPLGD